MLPKREGKKIRNQLKTPSFVTISMKNKHFQFALIKKVASLALKVCGSFRFGDFQK